jgi:hypothetical protein
MGRSTPLEYNLPSVPPKKTIVKLHLKKFKSAKALESERKSKSISDIVNSWTEEGQVPCEIIEKLLRVFEYMARDCMEYEQEDAEEVINGMIIYGDRIVERKGRIRCNELPMHLFVSST